MEGIVPEHSGVWVLVPGGIRLRLQSIQHVPQESDSLVLHVLTEQPSHLLRSLRSAPVVLYASFRWDEENLKTVSTSSHELPEVDEGADVEKVRRSGRRHSRYTENNHFPRMRLARREMARHFGDHLHHPRLA